MYECRGAVAPSRLIDVTFSRGKVRLCDTSGLQDTSYACLSYCWGDSRPLQLTKETELMLRNGIDYTALPRTFRDTIHVTRMLGLQYLWIDAL